MNKYASLSLFLTLLLSRSATSSDRATEGAMIAVHSPDGQVRIEFRLQTDSGVEALPVYRVWFQGQPIILNSRLGVDLVGEPPLGGPCVLESVSTRSRDVTYTQFPGKRRHVVDHCTEVTVSVRERTPPGRRWELVFRAYDHGVAFRYRFPAQAGWPHLNLASERTAFTLPKSAMLQWDEPESTDGVRHRRETAS
jgi:alpha-glucosidase